jgi:hypothetical protein
MRSDVEQVPCQFFGTLHRWFMGLFAPAGAGDVPQSDAPSHSWNVDGREPKRVAIYPTLLKTRKNGVSLPF